MILRNAGETWRQVAQKLCVEFGCRLHHTTIRQACVRLMQGAALAAPSHWTEERIAQLKEMHGRGLKARQISEAFGIERNAVIGKLNRLGMSTRLVGRPKVPRPDRPARAAAAQPRLPRLVSPPLFLEEKEYVPGTGVTLEQLELHHCRWPLNTPAKGEQYFFCGEARAERAPYWYCPHHMHAATYSSAKAA